MKDEDAGRWALLATEWEYAAARLAEALRCQQPMHPLLDAYDSARLGHDFTGFGQQPW